MERYSLIRGDYMKVWKLDYEYNKYESFQLVEEDRTFLEEFEDKITRGNPCNGSLDNLKVHIIDGRTKGDFPILWNGSGILVFSENVKKSISSLISNEVEFIPLIHNKRKIYLVNVLNIIDAIDYGNSEFKILRSGKPVSIKKYAFSLDKIRGENIFRVLLADKIYSTETYVTSEFKNIIESNNLKGFRFIEVWDSELKL